MIGRERETQPRPPTRHPAQHRDLDRAPQPQQIFDAEDDHREDVEGPEIRAVARGESVDRLGGKGDGVQDDESDDEAVDQAAGGMRRRRPPRGCRGPSAASGARRSVARHALGAVRRGAWPRRPAEALPRRRSSPRSPRAPARRVRRRGRRLARGRDGRRRPCRQALRRRSGRARRRRERPSEIVGDADDEAGLALLADADNGDDARAQLLLGVVDQAAQILRRDAVHGAGEQLDRRRARGRGCRPRRRRCRRQARARAWRPPAGARACGARR